MIQQPTASRLPARFPSAILSCPFQPSLRPPLLHHSQALDTETARHQLKRHHSGMMGPATAPLLLSIFQLSLSRAALRESASAKAAAPQG